MNKISTKQFSKAQKTDASRQTLLPLASRAVVNNPIIH